MAMIGYRRIGVGGNAYNGGLNSNGI